MSTHIINFPGADIHTTTLTSVSNVSVGENLDVTSNLTVSGDATVSGNVEMSSNLTVSGDATVSGNVELSSNLTVSGDATVSGNVELSSNLTVFGNVGVGVPNPTSRFEVAGADGVQEYPPKAMTGYETYMEGHGVFRASASSEYSTLYLWKAFDKSIYSFWHGANTDLYTSGIYSGTQSITDYNGTVYGGEWISIELPYQIYMSSFSHAPRTTNPERPMEAGVLLGWSQLLSGWEVIKQWTGLTWTLSEASVGTLKSVTVNATKAYNKFVFVITKTNFTPNVAEIKIIGTPTPSSLEDGHLTLGKALTLPRVSGHPTGVETPRAESLVVHYDTTVDSVVSGSTVVDISGNGRNGTLFNGAAYSSTDRALTFDGVNDYVSGTLNNPSGAWVHSISFWMKPSQDQSTMGTTFEDVFQIGNTAANGKYSAFEYYNNFAQWYWYSSTLTFSGNIFSANKWVYITLVTNGTTASIYLDGALKTSDSPFISIPLNLDANASLYIGKDGTRNRAPWGGSISNFKIWNVALTAEEVAMEYALGRTGKSINLTDTALCLGGTVPRAQLDVRGVIYAESLLGLNDSTVAYKYFDTETTVYTFSGLNLQVGEAYKIIWHYHNVQANHTVHMFVNGDETNGNYWHSIEQVTSSYTSSGSKIANSAKMFETGGNSDHIWVYDLRLTWDRRPMMMGHGHFSTPSAALSSSSNQAWRLGTWNHNVQTNAITSLKFDPTSSGSFGAGSSIRILKTM